MGRVISLLSLLGIGNRYYETIEEVEHCDSWRGSIEYDDVFARLETSNSIHRNT